MATTPFRRAAATRTQRLLHALLVAVIAALSVVYLPAEPAAADPPLCTVREYQAHPIDCTKRLRDVAQARAQCLDAPVPVGPSDGLAGYFASEPDAAKQSGTRGLYTDYGYAGLQWHTYAQGCAGALRHPENTTSNWVANIELTLAVAVIGAANAVRDKAWSPGGTWSWADPLVEGATRRVYEQVFTVWGVVVVALVGLYLMWQSRKASMSKTVTTVGWALFVMVLVTAVARWPVASAHFADKALTSSVTTMSQALAVDQYDPATCRVRDIQPEACEDHRTPAVRASDTATTELLYRNWLRGTLGSADSTTAKKYGMALYEASSLDWADERDIAARPETRKVIIEQKQERWNKIAEQIKDEDPAAYQNLTGDQDMNRIGAGFFALLSALCYAAFDLIASVMVLLGFLIFRWAVIAAPLLGTIGLLQPASSAIKKLGNAVLISGINVVVFSVGGSAYVSATNLIMNSPGLASWLKLLLILLSGIAGWMLLRKYRRVAGMAQLHDPVWMHRRMMRQMRRQGRRSRHVDERVGEEIVDAVEKDHHEEPSGDDRPDGEEIRWGRHRSRRVYYDDDPADTESAGRRGRPRTASDDQADERGLPDSGGAGDPRPARHAGERVDGGEVRSGRRGRVVVEEVEQEAWVYRPGSGRETGNGHRPGLDEES